MKNHYFSSRILFVFFGLLSISYFAQLFAGSSPLFYVYFICILVVFLPALYMHFKAKQLKRKLDDEEMHRQLADREWFEQQQRMQWNAEQQRQQNAGPYQYQQNGVQQQYWQNPMQQQRKDTVPPQPKTVTCTGCGARAMILPEENKNCEYCGFTLNYS
jgi:cell division protein FtsL